MSRVFTIPNFLTNQECTQVVTKCISELNLQQAFISEDKKLNLKYRKSSIAFTNNIELIYKRLTEKLIKSIKVTGYSIADLEHFQFTEYQVGEFYEWHRDSQTDSPELSKRFYSTVIQLSDNYTGGELQLIENGKLSTLPRGLGSLYMFPSYYKHRVRPITSGIRYSFVNWVSLVENINELKPFI